MIENSSYISLQNYTNKSNIIATEKYRPNIKKICDINVTVKCDTEEVPLRYLCNYRNTSPKSSYIKEGKGLNKNNYYKVSKRYVYTRYDLEMEFKGSKALKKRYNDISIFRQYCIDISNGSLLSESNYIDVVYKAMNRFNYIMDNSCYIINSGYNSN